MRVYLFGIGKKTIVAAIVFSIIGILVLNFGVKEEFIIKLYSEIQRIWGKKLPKINDDLDEIMKEKIRNDPKLLDYHVRREVDWAIREYNRKNEENTVINMKNKDILNLIESPEYSDTQRQIIKDAVYYEFADGTIGIRGIWVSPDPREIPLNQ